MLAYIHWQVGVGRTAVLFPHMHAPPRATRAKMGLIQVEISRTLPSIAGQCRFRCHRKLAVDMRLSQSLPEHRLESGGQAREAQVGRMRTVDRRLVVIPQ